MACGNTLAFRPPMVRAHAGGSGDQKRKGSGNGGGAWWSPLFGWGAEPDYSECVDATSPGKSSAGKSSAGKSSAGKSSAGKSAARAEEMYRRRYSALTEAKAKELRIRIMETESFHDAMYHSAIASRLASHVRRQS